MHLPRSRPAASHCRVLRCQGRCTGGPPAEARRCRCQAAQRCAAGGGRRRARRRSRRPGRAACRRYPSKYSRSAPRAAAPATCHICFAAREARQRRSGRCCPCAGGARGWFSRWPNAAASGGTVRASKSGAARHRAGVYRPAGRRAGRRAAQHFLLAPNRPAGRAASPPAAAARCRQWRRCSKGSANRNGERSAQHGGYPARGAAQPRRH